MHDQVRVDVLRRHLVHIVAAKRRVCEHKHLCPHLVALVAQRRHHVRAPPQQLIGELQRHPLGPELAHGRDRALNVESLGRSHVLSAMP